MSNRTLRERLLEQENRSADREERFKNDLLSMMERKLTSVQKISWSIAMVVSVFFIGLFTYLAFSLPRDVSPIARLILVAGAVFGAGWIALGISILRQGKLHRVKHENAVHGITFGFVLLLLVLFQVVGGQMENRTEGILMMMNGVVGFMVFGIPALFIVRINRTEAALREHLLRVELELAELADAIRDSK